jgi:hypothetical protein
VRGAVGLYCNLLPSYLDGGFGTLPFVSSVSYSQPAGSVPSIIGDSSGNISNITPQTLDVSTPTHCRSIEESGCSPTQAWIRSSVAGSSRASVLFFPDRPAVPLYPAAKTHREWFNPAAFTARPNFTYGTSGYNMLWGPHYQNWDMNLIKNITWKERYTFKSVRMLSTSSITPTLVCPELRSGIPLPWAWLRPLWARHAPSSLRRSSAFSVPGG